MKKTVQFAQAKYEEKNCNYDVDVDTACVLQRFLLETKSHQ